MFSEASVIQMTSSPTILDKIFAAKRQEVVARMLERPLAEVETAALGAMPPMDFIAALKRKGTIFPALIAEIKFASPSRGMLLDNHDPVRLASLYQENGAAALSILTDEKYFQGSLEYLEWVAQTSPRLPLLRKDFIYHPYQVYEGRAAGADAMLLIVAELAENQLLELHQLINHLNMDVLVEVHTLEELQIALRCKASLIGINNRDLHTFQVSLETTRSLRPHIPSGVCVVAESGIHTWKEASELARLGIDAMLVGEALVTAADIGAKVRELTGLLGVDAETPTAEKSNRTKP